jgi:hypothetical protein
MQLRPRHGHAGDFTPSELAEMLVDPYDDSPKCKHPSSCISGHPFKLNTSRACWFARYEGHHRGRLWGHPPSRLGEPVVPLQADRVSTNRRSPGTDNSSSCPALLSRQDRCQSRFQTTHPPPDRGRPVPSDRPDADVQSVLALSHSRGRLPPRRLLDVRAG